MTKLNCSSDILKTTIDHFRAAGRTHKECVVFWLVPRQTNAARIVEVYRPQQQAHADQFWIPPDAMTTLMRHLREHKLKLAAQIHSHPQEAFHSRADDHWAVIRHAGALSIVVPDFASHTDTGNFMHEAKFYQLSHDDRWSVVECGFDVLEVVV